MRQVRDAIADILDSTTLADVIAKVDEARHPQGEPEVLMYDI
jgi:DNA-binding IscR family transcriptional regulator